MNMKSVQIPLYNQWKMKISAWKHWKKVTNRSDSFVKPMKYWHFLSQKETRFTQNLVKPMENKQMASPRAAADIFCANNFLLCAQKKCLIYEENPRPPQIINYPDRGPELGGPISRKFTLGWAGPTRRPGLWTVNGTWGTTMTQSWSKMTKMKRQRLKSVRNIVPMLL